MKGENILQVWDDVVILATSCIEAYRYIMCHCNGILHILVGLACREIRSLGVGSSIYMRNGDVDNCRIGRKLV